MISSPNSCSTVSVGFFYHPHLLRQFGCRRSKAFNGVNSIAKELKKDFGSFLSCGDAWCTTIEDTEPGDFPDIPWRCLRENFKRESYKHRLLLLQIPQHGRGFCLLLEISGRRVPEWLLLHHSCSENLIFIVWSSIRLRSITSCVLCISKRFPNITVPLNHSC